MRPFFKKFYKEKRLEKSSLFKINYKPIIISYKDVASLAISLLSVSFNTIWTA